MSVSKNPKHLADDERLHEIAARTIIRHYIGKRRRRAGQEQFPDRATQWPGRGGHAPRQETSSDYRCYQGERHEDK